MIRRALSGGSGRLDGCRTKYFTLGGGIAALPSTRSTEGQFPYWFGMDDRLIADEFFRGSYTTGFWVKGELSTKVKYVAMLANNLSTLGVSASQLDNTFDTTTHMLQWLPSTGEFSSPRAGFRPPVASTRRRAMHASRCSDWT